ncbi:hypothetical protein F4802DRAFT_594408 [Xylaria palmicola]|nr:hypothetical protein F4802DRAFT_594408 [Xylaria palmicola]
MSDTVVHRCGLCKRTFKQKSSLVRHAKRCTLDPTPSVRQKACRSCVVAKARCDLRRPVCSRCGSRSVPCTYSRPARNATTANSGSAPDAGPGLLTGCALPGLDLDPDAGAQAIADADAGVSAYLDCGADFTGLPGPESTIHECLVSDLFPPGPADVSDATPTSEPGLHAAYPTPGGTSSTCTAAPYTLSGHSTSPYGGSLDGQLDSDSSPGVHADPPLVLRDSLEDMPLLLDDTDSFSPTPIGTAPAPGAEEIEPWILELAAKSVKPDPLTVVGHSSTRVSQSQSPSPSPSPSQPQSSFTPSSPSPGPTLTRSWGMCVCAAQTLFRIFRSWPRMLAKGIQMPPIIHLFQFCTGGDEGIPKHIARCVTLCKMWVGQAADSGQIVQSAAMREAENILAKYRTYDAPTLLAAMQSLMVLLALLFFPSNRQGTVSVVPGHIFASIQEMACHVLSTGMLLHEEASHERPPWRIWAHIEAKRRTLISIYFLHWAYSAYHGTRHFNCLQLSRMLAPGPKWLWQATDERTWAGLYARWLAQWDGRELIQGEFFLVEKGPAMDPRVEMWLEDADEFGLMMVSIMNASQRDLTKIPGAEGHIVG